MGAFILYPVVLFSVFITSLLGFLDFVHVSTLVRASAQTAISAAVADVTTSQNQGQFGASSPQTVDATHATSHVAGLLAGSPISPAGHAASVPTHTRVS